MGDTPVCTIDKTGIHKPDFATVLDFIKAKYRGVYGEDVYLENDSQDGQFLAIFATAINDANSMAVSVYNSYSPSSAQGVGLSRAIKINGMTRKVATHSSAVVEIVGVAGTVIVNGVVRDENNYLWVLPPEIIIPYEGTTLATAVCTTPGAIVAPIGSIVEISTPQPGWQTVYNHETSTPGTAVEEDVDVRARQQFTAALPAKSSFDSLMAGIAAVPGVTRYRGYENPQPGEDNNSIPGHSIALVIEGGNIQEIVDVIALKKGQGVNTYGNTSYLSTTDEYGISRRIDFSIPENIPITYFLQVRTKAGFTADILTKIRQAMTDWTDKLGIGNDVLLIDAYIAARLQDDPVSAAKYSIVPDSLRMSRDGRVAIQQDIGIAFNEAAFTTPSYINIQTLG